MKYMTLSLLALCVFFSLMAMADPKVDFSGHWVLNRDASELPQGRRRLGAARDITITQTDNMLTIERTMTNRSGEERTVTEKYTLDGKECENKTNRGVKKSTVTWSKDGKMLIIKSTREFTRRNNRSFKIQSTEKWSLGQDGNHLTIEVRVETPRGERTFKTVYDRKE